MYKRQIPVYGSGGWISYSDEELLEEVLDYKNRGFTAVKIKVGHPDGIERDMHRLSLIHIWAARSHWDIRLEHPAAVSL